MKMSSFCLTEYVICPRIVKRFLIAAKALSLEDTLRKRITDFCVVLTFARTFDETVTRYILQIEVTDFKCFSYVESG